MCDGYPNASSLALPCPLITFLKIKSLPGIRLFFLLASSGFKQFGCTAHRHHAPDPVCTCRHALPSGVWCPCGSASCGRHPAEAHCQGAVLRPGVLSGTHQTVKLDWLSGAVCAFRSHSGPDLWVELRLHGRALTKGWSASGHAAAQLVVVLPGEHPFS